MALTASLRLRAARAATLGGFGLACACGGGPPPATGPEGAPATPAPAAPSGGASAPSAAASATSSPNKGELIGVPIPASSASAAPSASPGGERASVELVYVESKPQKPPLKRLLFDVTLRNQRTEPRWFLLPSVVHPKDKMLKGGIDAVEVFTLQGAARVIVGRFLGTGGFQAVLLPPSSEVKLSKMPIECWYPSLKECAVPIEVVIARQLTVGGEPAESWLGDKPTSDARGEVSFEGAKQTGTKRAPANKELPAAVSGTNKVQLALTIGGG